MHAFTLTFIFTFLKSFLVSIALFFFFKLNLCYLISLDSREF